MDTVRQRENSIPPPTTTTTPHTHQQGNSKNKPDTTSINGRIINLHFRTVCSGSLLSAWRNFAPLGYPKCAKWRLWEDCANVQADLNLRLAQMFEGMFSEVVAQIYYVVITNTRLFKYIENFKTKKGNFSDKKFWYFSNSCSKHRLWVLVRTASARRF